MVFSRESNVLKKKSLGFGVRMDTINDLPDEIVIKILSFLSIDEAASTSILSKRWLDQLQFNFNSLQEMRENRTLLFQLLKSLSLYLVQFDNLGAFEKPISACPLLQEFIIDPIGEWGFGNVLTFSPVQLSRDLAFYLIIVMTWEA